MTKEPAFIIKPESIPEFFRVYVPGKESLHYQLFNAPKELKPELYIRRKIRIVQTQTLLFETFVNNNKDYAKHLYLVHYYDDLLYRLERIELTTEPNDCPLKKPKN